MEMEAAGSANSCNTGQSSADNIGLLPCSEIGSVISQRISDSQENEAMITEVVTEDTVENDTCDNLLNKSMTIDCLGISTNNSFSQNIVNDEINRQEKIKNGNSIEGNIRQINPAPNVDEMITDESQNCSLLPPSTHSVPMSDSGESAGNLKNESNLNSNNSDKVNESFENNNTVPDLKEDLEENRNKVIIDAMNKDQKWKTDTFYKKDLSSLKLLCDYGSDSDDDNNVECKSKSSIQTSTEESEEAQSSNNVEAISSTASSQNYRKPESDESETDDEEDDDSEEDSSEEEESSTTSSEETSSSSDESENSSNDNDCVIVEEKKRPAEVPKTKGELELEDLPPIEDLHISVPEALCVEIGKVLSIVDSLVVVQSIKGCPTLDLDSILFLDHGQSALGQVFDVFGKVGEACYCVRFNSKDHALEKGVEAGMPVYFAPHTKHSKFVFLTDLMKMKGSDASWEHNNEPPDRYLDYSDDEEERFARKGDKPICREVEPEETQPQSKRAYKRGGRGRGWGRGGGGGGGGGNGGSGSGSASAGSFSDHSPRGASPAAGRAPRGSATSPRDAPFNPRFCRSYANSLPPPPSPFGRRPLFRPAAFTPQQQQQPPPPQPATSPWAVPPPALRQSERYTFDDAPPPYSPSHPPPAPPGGPMNMAPGGFGAPAGSYGPPPGGFGVPPGSFGAPAGTFSAPSGAFGVASSGFGAASSGFGAASSGFGAASSGFGEASGSFVNPRVFDHPPPPPGTSPFGPQNAGNGPFGAGTFGSGRPQQFDFGSSRPNGAPPAFSRNGGPSNVQFGRQDPMIQNHNGHIPPQQGWLG